MPDLTTLIAGALLTLPALLLIVSGQLYLLHGKVKPMSLLQDVIEPFFEKLIAELKAKIEEEAAKLTAPLHDKILQLEAELGLVDSDKDALPGVLEQFGARLLAAVEPPAGRQG